MLSVTNERYSTYTTRPTPTTTRLIIKITRRALDRGALHNSRRPLNRLTLTVTLTFDLLPNIHWWARYRDGLSICQVWYF